MYGYRIDFEKLLQLEIRGLWQDRSLVHATSVLIYSANILLCSRAGAGGLANYLSKLNTISPRSKRPRECADL